MPNNDLVDPRLYVQLPPTDETNEAWNDPAAGDVLANKELARKNPARVKGLLRCGVPDGIRSLVWSETLEIHRVHDREKNYKRALQRVFGNKVPDNLTPPLFGGHLRPDCLALNHAGVQCAQRIMAIIAFDFPNLEFCPFIPPIVCLLLHHLTQDEVLGIVTVLVRSSLNGSGSWTYFPTYRRDIQIFCSGFADYFFKRNPKLYQRMQDLHGAKKERIWDSWLTNFFIGTLPLPLIFRVLDAFLHEGFKVLYRFALAIVTLKRNEVVPCTTYEELVKVFGRDVTTEPLFEPSQESVLARTAFTFHMRSNEILAHRQAAARLSAGSDPSLAGPGSADSPGGAGGGGKHSEKMFHRPKPNLSEKSSFAADEDWVNIWSWVPPRHRLLDLKLVFTTKRDGHNLRTLYDRAGTSEPLVLLVETTNNRAFGTYISRALRESTEKGDRGTKFIGTGETFLFSLNRDSASCYCWVGSNCPEAGSASAAPGSEAEKIRDAASFFVHCGRSELAVGGGG